jgi:hypothetical protein
MPRKNRYQVIRTSSDNYRDNSYKWSVVDTADRYRDISIYHCSRKVDAIKAAQEFAEQDKANA